LIAQNIKQDSGEQYRPQIHFTPERHWVNDPNGMVFHKGTYHLFFQHSPTASIWSDISWGHATSKDLVHWKREPIAIYPDSLGLIFSGSAVVDKNNSSGFGKNGVVPLVAMYTSHDMKKEKAGAIDVENQSIAYSLDEGKPWIKYHGNPTLKNPGVRDFRDPKIIWHEETKRWIVAIAAQDQITFYASTNLLDWVKLSDFGKTDGAHGGVWECPDLFPMEYNNKTYWVLLVNLNPGGPNTGSATQYFIGDFDGKKFTNENDEDTKLYVDFGKDFYAAVPFSNAPKNQNVWLGWMLSWKYAKEQPTFPWKGQMSLARKLSLVESNQGLRLQQKFVPDFDRMAPSFEASNFVVKDSKFKQISGMKFLKDKTYAVDVKISGSKSHFSGLLIKGKANEQEWIKIGFDEKTMKWKIDRSHSGKIISDFFDGLQVAPAIDGMPKNFKVVIDRSTVELLAQNGTVAISALRFPQDIEENVYLISEGGNTQIQQIKIWEIK